VDDATAADLIADLDVHGGDDAPEGGGQRGVPEPGTSLVE
jgi:hypothetical protein